MSVSDQMALVPKFPYQRLGHEGGFDDYDEERDRDMVVRSRNWWYRSKRVPSRRRFKLKVPWGRVLKRLKEGQGHFGDLFAGNYLFIQVNPTPLKCLKKDHDLKFNGLSSRYSLPRVA